jgi:toxin ParE1/3/4
MSGFFLTRKAREDLKGIARYTETTWGRTQRNQYLGLLYEGFAALAGNPLLGTDCAYKYPGIIQLTFLTADTRR